MEKTTAEQTEDYIKTHPDIKRCLKKGILNYSSLARLITQELHIEKKTSKEAILIAARRFREKLKTEEKQEEKIKHLLAASEVEIKNKILVIITEKEGGIDTLETVYTTIKKEAGTFFFLEGSNNFTIITQEKYEPFIEKKLKSKIIQKEKNLALITFKSPKGIEHTMGVISFLTNLFAEHGVNIAELLSCWTDTLFVINAKDVNKALEFLQF